MTSVHVPVLIAEVLEHIRSGTMKVVVDGTFGGGGHTAAVLEKYPDVKVIGIDRDRDAIERGERVKAQYAGRLSLYHGNYQDFDGFVKKEGVETVDGFLLDIGVSSDMLDDPDRGFSFQKEGPLDMRMDRTAEKTAAWIVNRSTREELADILYLYGEEHRSRRIAAAIVEQRRKKPLETTTELAALVSRAIGRRGKIHPATKTFQALRIAVNDELRSLDEFLKKAAAYLSAGGRILVITFHSLEDRIVKNFFREQEKAGVLRIITKKPLTATDAEAEQNPRARSAKLRVAERTA